MSLNTDILFQVQSCFGSSDYCLRLKGALKRELRAQLRALLAIAKPTALQMARIRPLQMQLKGLLWER